MTISVKLLAEPASFAAEMVVQSFDADGVVTGERVLPMPPGYMVSEYVHSSQRIVIREVKP